MEKEGDRKYERDCKGKRELGNKENEGRKWKEESGRGSSKEVKIKKKEEKKKKKKKKRGTFLEANSTASGSNTLKPSSLDFTIS